jgi:hypothetical protein
VWLRIALKREASTILSFFTFKKGSVPFTSIVGTLIRKQEMQNDLAEIYDRISYCENEILVVERETNTFLQTALKITREISNVVANNPERADYCTLINPISISIRSRSGSIMNELRATLDSLACNLAIRNNPSLRNNQKELKPVFFPINESKGAFDQNGRNAIRKLTAEDQRKIADLKPYKGEKNGLFLLHEIDRLRKHQKLAANALNNDRIRVGNLVDIGGRGGVGKVIILNSSEGGIAIENMTLDQNKSLLSDVGQKLKLFNNVPANLRIHYSFHLVYMEPDVAKNKDVLELLKGFTQVVRHVVDQFNPAA